MTRPVRNAMCDYLVVLDNGTRKRGARTEVITEARSFESALSKVKPVTGYVVSIERL